jgi:hypothetical protein
MHPDGLKHCEKSQESYRYRQHVQFSEKREQEEDHREHGESYHQPQGGQGWHQRPRPFCQQDLEAQRGRVIRDR